MGWGDPIQVPSLSLEFSEEAVANGFGRAVPKIDFRDGGMRGNVHTIWDKWSAQILRPRLEDCWAWQEMNIHDAPAELPFPIWTNYCLGPQFTCDQIKHSEAGAHSAATLQSPILEV